MKDPTEELTVHILSSLWSWDISLALNMTYFFFYVILNDSEGSHRRTDGAYTLSLWSWDISLALNMTYFFLRHSERSEESHRRTDGYIFLALVVRYFANAQYDVLFYLSLRGKRSDEANSREGGGLRSISSVLFRWDISLALNMTTGFLCRLIFFFRVKICKIH